MSLNKPSTGSNFYVPVSKTGKSKRVKAGTKGVDVKGAFQTRRGVTPGGRDYEAKRNMHEGKSEIRVGRHVKFRGGSWDGKERSVVKIQSDSGLKGAKEIRKSFTKPATKRKK